MTRKEFYHRIDDLGYNTWPTSIGLQVRKNDQVVATVEERRVGALDTTWVDWTNAEKKKLLDIIVEYAKTPLKDREEPKKYYLKAAGVKFSFDSFLNYDTQREDFFLADDEEFDEFQTQFTEQEIENLPEWCQALERIEVKE